MGIKTVPQPPYSPDLAPCDFCLFPKLRGYRYETIEEMKEAVMKVIDTLTQEDFNGGLPEAVGTVQQVHCSWRRLLRRGLEFHVCTINKSPHTKKSLETYLMILVFSFFYMHTQPLGDQRSTKYVFVLFLFLWKSYPCISNTPGIWHRESLSITTWPPPGIASLLAFV